ncbi:sulfite exporter TauE/SafE family protein [Massilia sp. METH4]|uniref:sulfite exporter TauE/SafE family protein n=1 Tax=Massilia sp. METH4 TaxID=3123041 RepID=UPI0030D1BC51
MMGLNLLPVLAVGLAGSVHCVGMCGGIVGALSATAPRRTIPIVPAAPALPMAAAFDGTARVLTYNAGRIASYMMAGALAGGFVNGAGALALAAHWQGVAYLLANAMLVALGLYLMNAWHGLLRVEAAGNRLWRRLLPAMKYLLPADTLPKAFALGVLWGWVPCGMVYSVLLTALLSGSAARGAAVMFAFGLGTLPMLLGLGMAGARLRQAMQHPAVRTACGAMVLGFGVLGLARHASGLSHGWLDVLCLAVPA